MVFSLLLNTFIGCNQMNTHYDELPYLDLMDNNVLSFSREDFKTLFEAYNRMEISKVGSVVIVGCTSPKEINISPRLYALIYELLDSNNGSVIVKSGPTAGARLARAFSYLDTCTYSEQEMLSFFDSEYGSDDIPLAHVYGLLSLFCGYPSVKSGDFYGIDTMCLYTNNCICIFRDDSSNLCIANFLYADQNGNMAFFDYYDNKAGLSTVSSLQSLYYYEF